MQLRKMLNQQGAKEEGSYFASLLPLTIDLKVVYDDP